MSVNTNILKNNLLNESPLPSAEYNKLPHIDDMRDVAAKHPKAHTTLLGIIATYGLMDMFSIHLVHKHFDMPEEKIMVYETVKSKNHGDFILSSPRKPEKLTNPRGLYFKAGPNGTMSAYEFTTDPGMDLSGYEDFVAKFSSTVVELGVQDVFALTAVPICPKDVVFTEFELGHVSSTVLVANPEWLPKTEDVTATTTDWLATEEDAHAVAGGIPGTAQLKCTVLRDNKHINVTCSTTRSCKHLGHTPNPSASHSPRDDSAIYINGELIPEGTEGWNIVTSALQMVDVA